MSALAEQHARFAEGRMRLGMPIVPVRRVSCQLIARVPVVVEPLTVAASVEKPKRNKVPRQLHWSRILLEVSQKHGIDEATLLGNSRFAHVVLARNEAMWRMRHEIIVAGKPMSFPQIGRRFGRDHSTIIHGVKCHQKAIDKSSEKGAAQYSPELSFASVLISQKGEDGVRHA